MYHLCQDWWSTASILGCILTLAAFIDHKLVFDELSEDLVAAAVFEAGDAGQEADWHNLMVLHPHFNLWEGMFTGGNVIILVLLKQQGYTCCKHKFK